MIIKEGGPLQLVLHSLYGHILLPVCTQSMPIELCVQGGGGGGGGGATHYSVL